MYRIKTKQLIYIISMLSYFFKVMLISLVLQTIQSKFQSFVSLYPFTFTGSTVWGAAGTHIVMGNSTLLQFYDFSSQTMSVINISVVDNLGIYSVASNTHSNYCLGLLVNLRTIVFQSNIPQCMNASDLNAFYDLSSWSFGDNTNQYLYTIVHNSFKQSYIIWELDQNITFAMNQKNYKILSQRYFNRTIFYTNYNVNFPTFGDLTIYQVSTPICTLLFHFTYADCAGMKIDVDQRYVLINCGEVAYIRYSYYPFNQVINIRQLFVAEQAVIMGDSIICKSKAGLLMQYNIRDGIFMDVKVLTLNQPNYITRISGNQLYIFDNNQGYILNMSQTIVCQVTCSCGVGYDQIGNQCVVKNYFLNISKQIDDKFEKLLQIGSRAIGNTLALTSSTMIMKSNVPITLFIEQFWLYKYYTNIDYPETMDIFMQQFQIISILRLKPNFMEFLEINYANNTNNQYQQRYNTSIITYIPLYYEVSTRTYFVTCLLTNILIFVTLKLTAFFFSGAKKTKIIWLKYFYSSLVERTQWWALPVMVIQGDFLILCFYSLNQISLPYFFVFDNKLNICGAILTLFVLIIYSFIGYSLINRYCKKFKVNLLVFTKYSRSSLQLQNYLSTFIKVMKAFAHCCLLTTPNKFLMLCFSDCVAILIVVFYRKCFFNKMHFIVYFLYQVGIFVINVLFLLMLFSILTNSLLFKQLISYTLISILVLVIMKFLLSLLRSFIQIYKILCNYKAKNINCIQGIRKRQRIKKQVIFQQYGKSTDRKVKDQNNYQKKKKHMLIVRIKPYQKVKKGSQK